MAMLIAGGLVPDLDYASYFGGPGAFLRFHRSGLHSVVGAVLMSCALALSFFLLDRKWPAAQTTKKQAAPVTFVPALALCALGAMGHDSLDLASGEGVQLLWPFQVHWSRWDLTQSFDPWILVLLIAGLLVPQLFRLVSEEVGARHQRGAASSAAVATLLLLFTYLGARAYLHGRAVDMLLSAEYHGREPLAAGAFPSSSDPVNWRGVVSTDNTLEEVDVSLAPGTDFNPDRSLTHYKPPDSPELDVPENLPVARRFLQYAEFPLASVARREDGYRVELRDLRFRAGDQSAANMIVRVELNAGLKVTRAGLRYASPGENN